MDGQAKETQPDVYKFFRYCDRYIDDLVLINNDGYMKRVMAEIYPEELVLVPEDSDDQSCSFLDLQVVIKDSIITTSIFVNVTRLIFLLSIFQLLLATSLIVANTVCLLVNWSAIFVPVHAITISRIGWLY